MTANNIKMHNLHKATCFNEIIRTYVTAIEEAGTRTTYEKECAKIALFNLADILDEKYSPNVFPSTSVKQWGEVNRGKHDDHYSKDAVHSGRKDRDNQYDV